MQHPEKWVIRKRQHLAHARKELRAQLALPAMPPDRILQQEVELLRSIRVPKNDPQLPKTSRREPFSCGQELVDIGKVSGHVPSGRFVVG